MTVSLLALACGAISVVGPGNCPAPALVEQRLGQVLSREQEQPSHWVVLVTQDGALNLYIFDVAGHQLGDHQLPTDGACDSAAWAAAAAIAAWETEWEAGRPAAPGLSPPVDGGAAAAKLSPRPVVSSAIPSDGAAPADAWTAGPWRSELGLGVAGSLADGLAPGALVLAGLEHRRWHLEVALALDSERTVALPVGALRWSRQALSVGVGRTLPLGRLELEVGLAVSGALQLARGVGLANVQTVAESNFALSPSLRLSWTRPAAAWAWQPWLELWGSAWSGSERLSAEGVGGSYAVPQWSVALSLGVSWTER